jgi:hypothetical protein
MVRRRDIAAAWYTQHWADAASVSSEGSVMGGWRLLDLHAEGSHLLLQDVVFMGTRGVCWGHSAGTGSGLVGVPAAVKVQGHRHIDVPVGASATSFANTRERYASISPSAQMQASAGVQHWAMQRGHGTTPRASAAPSANDKRRGDRIAPRQLHHRAGRRIPVEDGCMLRGHLLAQEFHERCHAFCVGAICAFPSAKLKIGQHGHFQERGAHAERARARRVSERVSEPSGLRAANAAPSPASSYCSIEEALCQHQVHLFFFWYSKNVRYSYVCATRSARPERP